MAAIGGANGGSIGSQCSLQVIHGVGLTAAGHFYNKTNFADHNECCSWCTSDTKCNVYTFHPGKTGEPGLCSIATEPFRNDDVSNDTISGSKVPVPPPKSPTPKPVPTPAVPTPAPTPRPGPGPIRPGSPNLVLFLTDDQDVLLGGFKPMEKTSKVSVAG